MRPSPAADDVLRFREAIARHFGLQFDDSKLGFLTDVLWRRLDAGRDGGSDYLARLERGPTTQEVAGLAPELTVPETYFFRNIDQFRAFSEVVLPERMRARGAHRVLHILSAGCATGEEPYSAAIAVRELGLDPSWEVSIRAIDLNLTVLERAARGLYSTWAMREMPPATQARWFRQTGRDLHLDDAIRARVSFSQRNLADEDAELWRPGYFDVVFCRNVLMYFTPRAAQAVVDRISRSLAPGGFLFLGHAETLRGLSHDFHLCHTHGTFYYRRKAADELQVAHARTDELDPSFPALTIAPADLLADSWVEAIGRAAERIRALSRQHDPTPGRPGPAGRGWDLRSPLELLRQERYGDALGALESLPPESARDPDVRLLEAVLLAHSGALPGAEVACRALLELDELNAGAHYVLALCREGTGDPAGATEHDQVAAYLDPSFAMPRLHLGLMARRGGDQDGACRQLSQALDLIQREDSSRLLFFGGGFNREALTALCRDALAACGGGA